MRTPAPIDPPTTATERSVVIDRATGPFALAETCGPVAWGRGRWPNVDWIDGRLVWVGWEAGRVVWRLVGEEPDGLRVGGPADPGLDRGWAKGVLGTEVTCPVFADPVVERLRTRHPGLRPFAAGSLFDGLVSSIVGQSISVASAAITGARLAALFSPGVEIAGRRFWPMPRAEDLASARAELVRSSGVTWRRAEALIAVGEAFADGNLTPDGTAPVGADELRGILGKFPLVGPWTTESTLLWGLGVADAYPAKDAALLRAARSAYDRPGMTHPELNRTAETWRPARGWAARLLWTDLLGAAPTQVDGRMAGAGTKKGVSTGREGAP